MPIEKLDRLAHLAPEMVVQSLKAFERHTELRRLERMLSHLRDRVREARLTPDTGAADRIAQLAEHADALDAVTRRMREFLVSFSDDRVRLNLITEELRQNVIELTMLPVASVFDAFPRAVRDLARTFNKEIELTVRGRETEVDKRIIDQIAEPLTHLIRNAVDHGIEAPDVRERLGKPREGQLILSTEQQGNRILITLKDDGGGIDVEKLRAVAIQRGVASASELERWSPEQLLDLIFQPGFSTRASATDVSGRGVGMDVVKSVVERLGGGVRIQSEIDKGTTVTLNLPLSLALLRVVLLEAGEELFALPTAAVRRILQVGSADIGQLQQGPVADVDGESIPLTALSAMLQVPDSPTAARQTVIVAEGSEGRFGILVEAVHEEQELVFKELRGPLRNQKTFTGAALLGNGDIVPILDVNALFDLASRAPSAGAAPCAAAPHTGARLPGARRGRLARRGRAAEEHSARGRIRIRNRERRRRGARMSSPQGMGPRRRRRRHAAHDRLRADRADSRGRTVSGYSRHHRDVARHHRRSAPRVRGWGGRVRAEARVRSEPIARHRQAPDRPRSQTRERRGAVSRD